MTNLKILDAGNYSYFPIYNCPIDNNSIKGMNLIELNITNNMYITDLNHLTKLRKLTICYSQVGDLGIKNLSKLLELNASHNPNVTDINHMSKLKKLVACGNCGVTNAGIKNVDLVELLVDKRRIKNNGI